MIVTSWHAYLARRPTTFWDLIIIQSESNSQWLVSIALYGGALADMAAKRDH